MDSRALTLRPSLVHLWLNAKVPPAVEGVIMKSGLLFRRFFGGYHTAGSSLLLAVALIFPAFPSPSLLAQAGSAEDSTLIVVVGAAGEEAYGKNFATWAAAWEKTAARAHAREFTIGLTDTGAVTDHDALEKLLASQSHQSSSAELWIVMIGHGTFDGKEAKFNLRGPDLSATELAAWLKPFNRPIALIDCASASAPFLAKLSAPGRVIVTATRSGYELNYARFGQYLAEAIGNPEADLDKDGQTSLLEAFIFASNRVAEFYKSQGRLATEHALIDDNGDGLGTPADWFRGIRAVKKAKEGATVDGLRAHQFHLLKSEFEQKLSPAIRARRNDLELAIAKLRDQKSKMPEDDYYRELETLLLQIARLYEQSSVGLE
jgi:hypothetical protein